MKDIVTYWIIDNNGRYWCDGGKTYDYCEARLADLISAGIVTESDEAEIVEWEENNGQMVW